MDVEKIRRQLKEKYSSEWWENTEEWLASNFGYPAVYPIPESMKEDYHPVFRDLLVSMFPISSELGGTKKLTGHARSSALDYRRIFPQYIGITDPSYSSRARNNFGLVQMLVEENDVFSRAFYNIPFPGKQKLKRLIMEVYGITKNGRRFEDIDKYPKGGVFLLHAEDDPEFDKLTKYRDYYYVPLKVRFPRNYREWLLTVDGSVLISRSAAKKLEYVHRRYALVRKPSPVIAEKFLLFTRDKIKEGARVHFQEPLSMAKFEGGEMLVGTSPVDGYVVDIQNLTPRTKNPDKVIWRITLEDRRPAEIGAKIESATGLKNTIAGYVDDDEPVIVINPEMFEDRNLYWEVKKTGKTHVYISLPGLDGNISTKGARISNTLIQGLFTFEEKVREKIIMELFAPQNLTFPFPRDIIKRLKGLDVFTDEFFPYMYYIRYIKTSAGNIVPNEQKTKLMRAIEEYHKVGWDRLPSYYKREINDFIKTMTGKLLLGDRDKRCAIRLKALQRIVLWHDNPDTDVIMMGKELIKMLGSPEYVLFWKEPVSRPENLRCMRVEHDPTLDGHPQAVRIHPYHSKDYGVNGKVKMRMKIDTDGDLGVILPIKNCIPELQYNENVRFKMPTLPKTIEDIEPPAYDYKGVDFLYEIYEYQRYRSIEASLIQVFGGIKNSLMYTDIIKDTKAWKEAMETWDIELQAMQLDRAHPELKKAPWRVKSDYLLELYKKGIKYRTSMTPPKNPFAQAWLDLPNVITFETFDLLPKMMRALRRQKHPVLRLFAQIYENVGLL